ncbi:PaaI family thioesterase [Marinibaculum pumilum]|uniref:PaaI family thioesterase n=1 Tax=Marinibaculum pumilum TaxID=1766165 RepID=A0ABV7KUR1_9PROT
MSPPRGIPDGFVERPTRGPFARLVGPYYEAPARGSDASETVRRGFQVEERHTNALGIAHGGMLMAFLDSVLAGAVATVAEGSFVTLRMTTDFLAPARRGDWVEGQAAVTRQTRSVCFVRGELRVGERRVATADAVFRLLPRRHAEQPDSGPSQTQAPPSERTEPGETG